MVRVINSVTILLCCVTCVQIEAMPSIMENYKRTRRAREENNVYGTQLNGNSLRAPLWPRMESENVNILLLPRMLNVGDEINVTCVLNEPKLMSMSLVTGSTKPDYDNIPAQLEFKFLPKEEEKILLNKINNGTVSQTDITAETAITPSGVVTEDILRSKLKITILTGHDSLTFKVGSSDTGSINLDQNERNNIRYITFEGDVEGVQELQFQFAMPK